MRAEDVRTIVEAVGFLKRQEEATMTVDAIDVDRAEDLDETRRLCYMALVYQRADGSHELAGTLINALLHHDQGEADRDEVIDRVLEGIAGEQRGLDWLLWQIDRVTGELA